MVKESIAATLKAHRELAGLSQEKLGAKADISPRNYRRIEAGTSEPSVSTLYKIAHALGIHYSDLLEPSWAEWLNDPRGD